MATFALLVHLSHLHSYSSFLFSLFIFPSAHIFPSSPLASFPSSSVPVICSMATFTFTHLSHPRCFPYFFFRLFTFPSASFFLCRFFSPASFPSSSILTLRSVAAFTFLLIHLLHPRCIPLFLFSSLFPVPHILPSPLFSLVSAWE